MIHRHLDYPARTRPDRLPSAALVDLLERGDLDAWRPVLAAVRRRPFGALADRILALLEAYPLYGTSPLWRAWIDGCRVRAEATPGDAIALDLRALRRRLGLTQSAVAAKMGMSQSDVSKLERRRDVRLSTLSAYAKALGGRVETEFRASGEKFAIRLGERVPKSAKIGRRG